MSGFNVNSAVETSTSKPTLEGFKIHDVEFKGVEKGDYKEGQYKVIVVKFENEHGQFRGSIFEPKPEGYTRTQSMYGPNPSVVEVIEDYFKQLVTAVNPGFYDAINKGGATPIVKNWEDMRNLFISATKDFVGTKVQIKLEKDKKGIAQFSSFPLAISKEGVLYRKTTYIGQGLGFNDKEIKAMNSYVQASPTPMMKQPSLDMDMDVINPKSSSAGLVMGDLD